jgi:hypothetical protein
VFSVSVLMSSQVFAELAMQLTVGFLVRPSGVESSDGGAPIDRMLPLSMGLNIGVVVSRQHPQRNIGLRSA